MRDIEMDLKEALMIETIPRIDEAKLRLRVRASWARRRRRAVGSVVALTALVASGLVVRATTNWTPADSTAQPPGAPAAARRPPPAPRPMFALALPLTPQRAAKAVADEIVRLRALLSRTPLTDPARADILLRMGEAYDEQRRAAASEGRAGARASAASAALIQWRAIYDDGRYRGYARLDEALFGAAWLLYEENRGVEAQALFQRILDQLPRSKFASNAALARAEGFFEAGNMTTALRYYQRVLEFPDAAVYGYASYKVGWAHYNLGANKEALAAFARVIDLGAQGKLHPRNREGLVKACRKDLVLAYSVADEREKAWPFFQRYGGDQAQALAMMERLAALYDEQGKRDEAAATRRELARLRSAATP